MYVLYVRQFNERLPYATYVKQDGSNAPSIFPVSISTYVRKYISIQHILNLDSNL